MAKHKLLTQLSKMLTEEQMDCALEKANDDIPYDRILIHLGVDDKNRERILEITAQEQVLTQDIPEKIAQGIHGEGFYRVQFKALFPFAAQDKALHDVCSTLLFINRMLELPGLELSEYDNKLSYRHVALTTIENMSKPLLLSIVGNILMILDGFGGSIETIANGEVTFNNLLEQVIEMTKKIPQ